MGGLHVSVCPDEAKQHADSVVLGEGEPAWLRLVDDLRRNRLQPIYDVRQQSFDLAESPIPRYELLDPARYNRITLQTQRGCPYRCEFCAASILISPHYKLKPIPKVLAELRRIKEIWPQPFIELADDNTFVNKRHAKELLRALRDQDVRWFTETDISLADDEELLSLLRPSGCVQVLIGFESPSLRGLDGLEQRANWKARKFDDYRRAIDRIQRHGVTVNGCFVLGLDGTGPESFDAVREFVQESGLYEVQVTIATAFPGTPLYARLKREGRILQERAWDLCTLFDVNFQPQQMTALELQQGFHQLVKELYSTQTTRARRMGFHRRSQGTTLPSVLD
jgi:radical SAM superfamily enzyme YgiQ (UPF0313 family)